MADLIAEGWQTFREQVLKKGWPDEPALRLLLEIAFYGGANWMIKILEEEGYGPDVLGDLTIELANHHYRIEDMRRRLEENGS